MTKTNSTKTKPPAFQATTNEIFRSKIYALAKVNQTTVTHIINELLFNWHLVQLENIKKHPELQKEYEAELLSVKDNPK